MATTTPNYGWPVPTSTDYVKDGATAIEALGDAIDATVFGLGSGSLSLIAQSSFTAQTQVDFTSVFSATYQNYLVINQLTNASTTGYESMYLLSASTPATANYYFTYQGITNAAAVNNAFGTNGGFGYIGIDYTSATDAIALSYTVISRPFEAKKTTWTGTATFGDAIVRNGGGYHNANTSYNGLRLAASAGNITGTARIYGYKNS
jgi:hypothetical protein